MSKSGPLNADRLKSFIERIERLETERAAIGGDIRDVYSEAKGVGYDVKTMRRIIQIRKKDAAERDEEEQLLDLYAHALGMVTGSADTSSLGSSRGPSEDELMAFAGKVVGEVELCLSELVVNGRAPKIEAIKSLIGCSTGKAHKLRAFVIERIEGFSSSSAILDENEMRETAAGTAGRESRHDRQPDGPGSALATLSDVTPSGAVDGDSPVPPAPSSQADGVAAPPATPAPTTGIRAGTLAEEILARRDGPMIDLPSGDAEFMAALVDGLTPEPEVARVVPPVPDLRYDPYEEAPPPFLDRRHKARATG